MIERKQKANDGLTTPYIYHTTNINQFRAYLHNQQTIRSKVSNQRSIQFKSLMHYPKTISIKCKHNTSHFFKTQRKQKTSFSKS